MPFGNGRFTSGKQLVTGAKTLEELPLFKQWLTARGYFMAAYAVARVTKITDARQEYEARRDKVDRPLAVDVPYLAAEKDGRHFKQFLTLLECQMLEESTQARNASLVRSLQTRLASHLSEEGRVGTAFRQLTEAIRKRTDDDDQLNEKFKEFASTHGGASTGVPAAAGVPGPPGTPSAPGQGKKGKKKAAALAAGTATPGAGGPIRTHQTPPTGPKPVGPFPSVTAWRKAGCPAIPGVQTPKVTPPRAQMAPQAQMTMYQQVPPQAAPGFQSPMGYPPPYAYAQAMPQYAAPPAGQAAPGSAQPAINPHPMQLAPGQQIPPDMHGKQRCVDFHKKGICGRGTTCKFSHI